MLSYSKHTFSWLIAGITLFMLVFATASPGNAQEDRQSIETLSKIELEVYRALKLAGSSVRGGRTVAKMVQNFNISRDVLMLVADAELRASNSGPEIHTTKYGDAGLHYFCWKGDTHLLAPVVPGAACDLVPHLAQGHTGKPLYFNSVGGQIQQCKGAGVVLIRLPSAYSCKQHPNGIEAD